jgi:hypothetical protein
MSRDQNVWTARKSDEVRERNRQERLATLAEAERLRLLRMKAKR